MRRLLIALSVVPALACSLTGSGPAGSEAPPNYVGLGLEALGAYSAGFEIRFAGDYEWVYELETRTDGQAVEYNLHLEGVSDTRNPGDVRAVIEGDTGRMRGPGTGDECLQFPSDLDLGLSFLSPDDLIEPQSLQEPPTALGSETIAGVEAVHYTLSQASLEHWHDLEMDLWRDEASGAVLRYDLSVAGPDPLFDAGEGRLSWQFLVDEIGPQVIEPVAGCEVNLPLPPDAARLVKLPGLIAFESSSPPSEIVLFYQTELAEAGWEPLTEPQAGADATLLSYRSDTQTLEINIEARGDGAYCSVNREMMGTDAPV